MEEEEEVQDLVEKEELEEDVKGQTGGSKTTGETKHFLSRPARRHKPTPIHTHTRTHVPDTFCSLTVTGQKVNRVSGCR